MEDAERRRAAEYALEKLGDAVQVLVTLDAKVTVRVARAAEHLLLINPKALPPELCNKFEALMIELSKHPGVWRSAFNLHGVRGTTGSKLALSIYSLESELRSHLDNAANAYDQNADTQIDTRTAGN